LIVLQQAMMPANRAVQTENAFDRIKIITGFQHKMKIQFSIA